MQREEIFKAGEDNILKECTRVGMMEKTQRKISEILRESKIAVGEEKEDEEEERGYFCFLAWSAKSL